MSTPTAAKVVLRLVGGVTVGAVVAAGGVAAATQMAVDERTRTIEVGASPLRTVVLTTDAGDVRVEEVMGARQVRVQARLHGAWHLPELTHEVRGNELAVDGECADRWPGECFTDLVVTVPAGMHVEVRTAMGDVSASATSGDLALHSSTGDVTAVDVRSTAVDVGTDLGDVDLGFASPPADVAVTAGTGDVHVTVPADGTAYAVQTFSDLGNQRTTVPLDANAARSIDVRTSLGEIRVGTAP